MCTVQYISLMIFMNEMNMFFQPEKEVGGNQMPVRRNSDECNLLNTFVNEKSPSLRPLLSPLQFQSSRLVRLSQPQYL